MKHRQHHNRIAVGFVTLAGGVLGLVLADQCESPEASAADVIFAPQFCVPVDPANLSFDESNTLIEASRLVNIGDRKTFVCPLIHNFHRDLQTVRVGMLNLTSALPSNCCVIAYDFLGEDSATACEEANEAEGFQTIQIAAPGSTSDGYYVVTCELEGWESIQSIRASE